MNSLPIDIILYLFDLLDCRSAISFYQVLNNKNINLRQLLLGKLSHDPFNFNLLTDNELIFYGKNYNRKTKMTITNNILFLVTKTIIHTIDLIDNEYHCYINNDVNQLVEYEDKIYGKCRLWYVFGFDPDDKIIQLNNDGKIMMKSYLIRGREELLFDEDITTINLSHYGNNIMFCDKKGYKHINSKGYIVEVKTMKMIKDKYKSIYVNYDGSISIHDVSNKKIGNVIQAIRNGWVLLADSSVGKISRKGNMIKYFPIKNIVQIAILENETFLILLSENGKIYYYNRFGNYREEDGISDIIVEILVHNDIIYAYSAAKIYIIRYCLIYENRKIKTITLKDHAKEIW